MKQKIMAIAVPILIIGAVVIFIYRMRDTGSDNAGSAVANASQTAVVKAGPIKSQFIEADVDIDELLQNIETVDFDYDQERIMRDPMTPLLGFRPYQGSLAAEGETSPASPFGKLLGIAQGYTVSGIVWDKEYPVAIIADQNRDVVVMPGFEMTEGIVVDTIESGRVILRIMDSLFPIELKER